MRIHHPATGQNTDVEPDTFRFVYAIRGWVEMPDPPTDAEVEEATAATSHTIDEVLATVGEDPELAAAALEAERSGKNRKTLVAALERIATHTEPSNPGDDATEAPAADSTEEDPA